MGQISSEDRVLLREIARSFAADYVDPDVAAQPAIRARRALLGPTTVLRTARALTGNRSIAAKIADIGLQIHPRLPTGHGQKLPFEGIDSGAPGSIVALALAAWKNRGSEQALVAVGPKCARWLPASQAALEPLIRRGELRLELASHTLLPRRCRAVIAPYYYAPADLCRLADLLVMERAVPCPHAETSLDIYIARGWDQRHLFSERLGAASSACEVAATAPVELDVDTTADLLEAARHVATPAEAISVFVYPTLREPPVEAKLSELLLEFDMATINHTPAVAWALGVGPSTVVVEADQRMRGLASLRAMTQRRSFDEKPSLSRAVLALAPGWLG